MQAYFADTWFFIALLDRRDAHHEAARRLARQIVAASVVTHDAVLTEVLNHFYDDGPGSRAGAVIALRQAVLTYAVVPATRGLFIEALELYDRRRDKAYSLVDCVSMVVMEKRGILHVLTNDHHFTQAGFTIVNQ